MAIEGLKKGQIEAAKDMLALKTAITAEMKRRHYNINTGGSTGGSLSEYGEGIWLYNSSDLPKVGGVPTKQQANKVITPVNAISKVSDEVDTGHLMTTLTALDAKIATVALTEVTSTKNDCQAYCSGLCATTCTGSCRSGCQGSCKAMCADDCTNSCKGTCQGTCQGTCSGDCYGGCRDNCAQSCRGNCGGCSDTCTGGCDVTCTNNCAQNCAQSCRGNCGYCSTCASCGGGCGMQCQSDCTGTCKGNCYGGCYTGCSGSCKSAGSIGPGGGQNTQSRV